MRTAIYMRSTRHEGLKDQGSKIAEQQLQFMRDLVLKNGDEIARVYSDKGLAFGEDRPAYAEMLRDAQQGRYDKLIFWELKQLSQQNASKTIALLYKLSTWGIAYISCTEPQFDSSRMLKEIILPIIETLGRQDSVYIGERTRAGIERQRRGQKPGPAGRIRLGRPPVRFDVELVRNMRYRQNPPKSLEEIAAICGVSKTTIHRFLASPEGGVHNSKTGTRN